MTHEQTTDIDHVIFLGAVVADHDIRREAREEAVQVLGAAFAHHRAQGLLKALAPLITTIDELATEADRVVADAQAALMEAHKKESLAAAAYWGLKAKNGDADMAALTEAQAVTVAAEAALEQAKQAVGSLAVPAWSRSTEAKLIEQQGKLKVRHIRGVVEALAAIPEPDLSVLKAYLKEVN